MRKLVTIVVLGAMLIAVSPLTAHAHGAALALAAFAAFTTLFALPIVACHAALFAKKEKRSIATAWGASRMRKGRLRNTDQLRRSHVALRMPDVVKPAETLIAPG